MKKFIKYLPIILLILQCGLIFFFSGQNEESSTNVSQSVVGSVLEVAPETAQNLNKKQYEMVELVVRKSAHFVLFLMMGIFAYLSAESLELKKKVIMALVFCLAYAVFDEIHQFFIPGRSCEIRDVIIDFCGSLIGVLGILHIKRKIRKEGKA